MTSDATSGLRLSPAEAAYTSVDGDRELRVVVPFLDYVVDGASLRELARAAGYGGGFVTGLCRAWPDAVAPTVADLLGGRGPEHVDLLVCEACGDRDCGALLAVVTVDADRVTWHDWRSASSDGTRTVDGLPRLCFDRRAYEAAVAAAPAAVARLPYDDRADRPRRLLWPWQWGWRLPPAP